MVKGKTGAVRLVLNFSINIGCFCLKGIIYKTCQGIACIRIGFFIKTYKNVLYGFMTSQQMTDDMKKADDVLILVKPVFYP